MANLDMVQKVYDHIISKPELFRMADWAVVPGHNKTPCGTIACLAGHATIMNGDAEYVTAPTMAYWVPTENWLLGGIDAFDISSEFAQSLFYMDHEQDAVNALRLLLETDDESIVLDYIRSYRKRTGTVDPTICMCSDCMR